MNRSERGSATLQTLFAAALLFTALTAAILWSAISTARHKLSAAADLTALSAAQSLSTSESIDAPGHLDPREEQPAHRADAVERPMMAPSATPPSTPCATAARTAALNKVQLTACVVSGDAVTVEVSLQFDLRLTRPTLSAVARAGPV
ncbi:flp pilus-assembly TadE/G-like family protein [Kribbella sp. NPDC003557]|uniref:flp pilus-assembly TadE/G-like family protein n=1 Tax=Kribbella sp. NPDC003557 TaxID=3154449 RepID=UPI0033BAD161